MKNGLLAALLVVLIGSKVTIYAQEVTSISEAKTKEDSLRIGYWEKNSQLGINFAQASFNDAWQGGGSNNIAIGFLYNARGDHFRGKGVWSNDLQFQYGILRNKGRSAVKSVDRLFFETKYARFINPKLNWFAGVNFLTQIAPGYSFDSNGDRVDIISNFLAPGFLSEGIGLEWKPVKYLAIQLGGATIRQTFVVDDEILPAKVAAGENRYGVAPGKTLLNEAGFQAVASFDKDIVKNVNLKWRAQAFYAYAPESKPIDVNLNLIATAKVNKYLNVNFTLIGIFDKDQTEGIVIPDNNGKVKHIQFSQGLAVGLSFKL